MAGRYLVTGIQLGLIKGILLTLEDTPFNNVIKNKIMKILDNITNNQFIDTSSETIELDVKKLSEMVLFTNLNS